MVSRGLHETGAHPIGIDLGPLDNEEFEAYGRVNLLHWETSEAYRTIDDGSIDVVHARFLFDSSSLRPMGSGDILREHLVDTLEQKVKPGAAFLWAVQKGYGF